MRKPANYPVVNIGDTVSIKNAHWAKNKTVTCEVTEDHHPAIQVKDPKTGNKYYVSKAQVV